MDSTVRTNIRIALGARHMSANQLAQAAAIPQSTLHRLMNGGSSFTLNQLERIATALETTAFALQRKDFFVTTE